MHEVRIFWVSFEFKDHIKRHYQCLYGLTLWRRCSYSQAASASVPCSWSQL